jgi:hypothetical protein
LIVDFDTDTPASWGGVLDLDNCCEGVFLHQGNNSSVRGLSILLFRGLSGLFGAPELTSGFFIFTISQPNDGSLLWQ